MIKKAVELSRLLEFFLKNQKYADKLRSECKNNPDEWEARAIFFSRHILAAISLRKTAYHVVNSSRNYVFFPIGLYYSIYHLSIFILALDYRTEFEKLKHIRHSTLEKKIEAFVETKFIDSDYVRLFKKLKKHGEYVNYNFGVVIEGNKPEELVLEYESVKIQFEKAIKFYKFICVSTRKYSDIGFRVRVGIGDGFGDDIMESYLSRGVRKKS
jgi:hypothetical protein